ncbi:MAG: DUF362 domain-containing protein [Verrucomicrobiota bacterium]
MKTPSSSPLAFRTKESPSLEAGAINRRTFLRQSVVVTGGCAFAARAKAADPEQPDRLKPIGEAKGINPGRVVWGHDRQVNDWKGPDDGHWWEGTHLKQKRVDAMLARAVSDLTGAPRSSDAWDQLCRYTNQSRGKGNAGYKAGEKIAIKPNWVGMIYREGHVDADRYTFLRRHDYMNTAPQMILGLLRQLTDFGVRQPDITVCDTLAYLVNEYYDILRQEFPSVRYEDYGGKFGRIKVRSSAEPLYWSSRPKETLQDFLPTCLAEADYLINFANFKAHQGAGVTLCAKNHYGSLIRWPVQSGYFDIHPAGFAKETGVYRSLVDLMGHAHLGGKTVLCLIDGLFSGLHPKDPVPQRIRMEPFANHWPCSLFASQDPVAIDSVALDFLQAEWTDFPRQRGVDDYLHEAALAGDPPSETFYDPNHLTPTRRLGSLGVHEHWNDPRDKKYSRNLGVGSGIELVKASLV